MKNSSRLFICKQHLPAPSRSGVEVPSVSRSRRGCLPALSCLQGPLLLGETAQPFDPFV